MKALNIFKKEAKTTTASKIQSLDKNQLSKVIGGTDSITTTDATESAELKEKKGLNAVNVKLA